MDHRKARLIRERLVVALDLDSEAKALALVEELGDTVDRYKVGARMFTRHGTSLLDALADRGARLFVDLKFHDIPSTVEGAVGALADRDEVFLTTVHAAGGHEMVRRAVGAAGESGPEVVAVTALTSLDATDVRRVAGGAEFDVWARELAELAVESGADGLVCSPQELVAFREAFGSEPTLVTPGIRPASADRDDQKRAATPARALGDGSDYLVVGRPIYRASDPREAVESIAENL